MATEQSIGGSILFDYYTAHSRIRADRGPAKEYPCAEGCGWPAEHWSYDHNDPDEIISADPRHPKIAGAAYSLNVDCYSPRCALCHKRFDRAHANSWAS